MGFNNIYGLGFLALIPVVLLFYLYKNKSQEKTVSSLFIWNKVFEKENNSKRALNKLKSCLSLLLQILAILAITIFIAQPYLKTKNKGKDIVLIADCSINMLAKDDKGGLMFDKEMADIKEFVSSLQADSRISVIKMDKNAEVIANKEDKDSCLNKLNSLKAGYNSGNINSAVTLAEEIAENNTQIYIFSINNKKPENENVHFYSVGEIKENTAIITAFLDKDNYSIKGQIKNYSDKEVERTVMLYGEDKLLEYKKLALKPKESGNILFENLKQEYNYYKLQIKENESLSADDTFYIADNNLDTTLKLYGEDNYYLNKAISAVFKGDIKKAEINDNDKNSAIRVYNGQLPMVLPKEDNILIINPKGYCDLFKVDKKINGEVVGFKGVKKFDYIDNMDFNVSEVTGLNSVVDFLKPIALSGDTPIIYGGKRDNQKIIVLSFDLYNSDLVLKADFPILIKNILRDFSENNILDKTNAFYNDEINANLTNKQGYSIITPKGDKKLLNASKEAIKAEEIGIYRLVAGYDNKNDIYLAVNPDLDGENDNFIANSNGSNEIIFNKDIKGIFALLALILMLAEWLVINNEN